MPALILLFSLTLLFNLIFVPIASAQFKSSEIASVYDIKDEAIEDGDIIVSSQKEQGLIRSKQSYDSGIFGVLQNQPLAVYKRVDQTGKPVTRYGTALVNVTTANGEINPGDYITTSELAGKGQKATQSGYVLGISLDSLKEGEGEQVDYTPPETPNKSKKVTSGKINVALRIEYAELSTSKSANRFFTSFNTALFQNVQDPQKFLQLSRYFGAGVVIIMSFIFAFVIFARSISKGVEAVGRNPLAEKAIRFSMAMNIFFTILTVAIGALAAFLIIKI